MNRRSLLAAASMLPLAGCALFSSSTVNGVTTITLNLTTLQNYAVAIRSGVNTILDIPGAVALLPAGAQVTIEAAVSDAVTEIGALVAQDNGNLSLSFTTTSVPAAISAFEADAQTILSNAATLFEGATEKALTTIESVLQALQTILLLAKALTSSVSAPETPLPESQALAILLPRS